MVPTMVTSSPSRIHTAPRPTTTSQCHRAHGSRSIRAGMFVSIVRSSTGPAISASLPRSAAHPQRHLPDPGFATNGGGYRTVVFLFFSSRLGCLGSLLVSALLTVVLLIILGVL
jgi:hypothetical protein